MSKYFFLKQALLKISGPDKEDFLQRLSTNELKTNKNPLGTCFLNNKGRLIDFVFVFKENDYFILLSSHTDMHILYDHLEKFHFSEDIKIVHEISLKPVAIIDESISFHLSLPENFKGELIDEETWQNLRILKKMPASSNEINENFMPQEVGLEDFISHTKGCYIGQEVIAKAFTYQKNRRRLVGLKLSKDELLKHSIDKNITSKASQYVPDEINALAVINKNEALGLFSN